MADPGKGEFADKSDVDLFGLIKKTGRESRSGKAAFGEFYRRYAGGVRKHVLAVHRSVVKCDDDLNEFVQLVFVRFWEYSLPVFDASVAKTPEEIPKLIRWWLANAALRIRQHWSDKQVPVPAARLGIDPEHSIGSTHASILDALAAREDDGSPEWLELERRFVAGLASLGQRERDVLLSCYRYFDESSGECRVEAEVRAKICAELRFNNWAAVRKCKERAEKKLRRALLNQAKVA
jgi:hypothetical protein